LHKFNRHILEEIIDLIDIPRDILITTHYNPDGDAIGSSLSLFHYLKTKGHNVNVLIPNDVPGFLHWMPGLKDAIIYYHHANKADDLIEKAEIIFCLDYNSISRVNLFKEPLKRASGKKILIDHHPDPTNEFDYVLSVIDVSSTAELIYDFISSLGDNNLINVVIGSNLYVGMMTDTGSFSYASNYPHTLETVADLIKKGVDTELIHRLVYDTYSENRMRLLGYSLSEKLIVLNEFSTAYIYLTKEDLKRFSFEPGDTEGVVNYALAIKNISFAALFTEKNKCIRISFRSKADFSVNDFAKKHYGGGGHRNAAGGDSYKSMEQTLQEFEKLLPLYKEKLLAAVQKSLGI
jgi:bifunctional oligoribonuclease and PAP phosphatase NrnA